MSSNVKEYDGNLFDQLEIVEEALKYAQKENAKETIDYLERKKRYIERKLYEKPPIYGAEG
ncbi:MAG: hypothetical protein IJT32_03540 [Lachnospiraceae bacterium]|nr:hypothetical protein [Lachnospiraceae bacterium]